MSVPGLRNQLLAAGLALGCSAEAPARPQLLVWVDTNAVVSGQLAQDPSLSASAALDTVRIDVLGTEGEIVDLRELALPDPLDWPISFGVAAAEGSMVEVRVRAFRAADARAGVIVTRDGDQRGALEPDANVAIDRLLWLSQPARGVQQVEVVLDADCLGFRPRFGLNARTCVDAQRADVAPSEGISPLSSAAPPSSRAGTWQLARRVPCRSPAPSGSVCIPGGISVLGDRDLVGLGANYVPAAPRRLVLLAPFFMDETEFTVARYEPLAAELATLPGEGMLTDFTPGCTYQQEGAASAGLPLNCVGVEMAEELCERSGGALPTEAQWEHAARGGRGLTYPWGEAVPSCCSAGLCLMAPKPVGAPNPQAGCGPLADVSRDGVRDLLGNLAEITRDAPLSYAHECWSQQPRLLEPRCTDPPLTARVLRGAAFGTNLSLTKLALRGVVLRTSRLVSQGFRCVYPDG